VPSVLPIAALLAQTDDADRLAGLEACVAIERSTARLACYDGVLGRPASPQESAAPATDGPTPAAAAAVAATAAATAATAPATSAAPSPHTRSTATAESVGDAARTVVIVEVRLRSPSSAVFVTEDGQIFEQTDTRRGRYPAVPFQATLEGGSLGSTFLVAPGGGPRIRVTLRQ
jgi:hypothetical protein